MIGRLSARQAASSAATLASASGLLRGPKTGSAIACCRSISRRAASQGSRMKLLSTRREDPIVKVENDARIIGLALTQGEVRAGTVLGRHGAQAQGADIVAAGHGIAFQNFAPGENRVAGEQRRDMTPAVDRRDMKRVGEPVEAQ